METILVAKKEDANIGILLLKGKTWQSKNTLLSRFLGPSWLFNSTCWAKVASKEWNNFSCWQSFKEGADILGFLLRKATLDNGLCYWSPCQSKKTLRLRQILIYSWASSCRQINNHKQTWPIWLGFLTICQSHLLRGFWGVITESHVIRLGDQRRVERNTVNHLFCLQFCTIIVFSRCCNLQIYTTCFILSDNVAFNATQFFLWIALLVLLVKICWYGKFLWFLLSWFWRRTRTVQVHALCNVQCVKYILQIVKCIFPSCIFPNFRIYLSKLLNLFVQIVNWPAGAICSWHWLKLRPFIGASLFDPRKSMKTDVGIVFRCGCWISFAFAFLDELNLLRNHSIHILKRNSEAYICYLHTELSHHMSCEKYKEGAGSCEPAEKVLRQVPTKRRRLKSSPGSDSRWSGGSLPLSNFWAYVYNVHNNDDRSLFAGVSLPLWKTVNVK